jgi:hypothetical protein
LFIALSCSGLFLSVFALPLSLWSKPIRLAVLVQPTAIVRKLPRCLIDILTIFTGW